MPSLTVRQNGNGDVRYQVRFRLNGLYSSRTFDTELQANEFIRLCDDLGDNAAALRYEARLAETRGSVALTLDKWFTIYKDTRTGVEERTVTDYQRTYDRHIKPQLGKMPIDAIDDTHVAVLIRGLERKKLSAKTIANVHGILSGSLNYAVVKGKIPINPCNGMRLPRTGETDRRDERFLTHAEFGRLEEALLEVNAHYWPLLVTLVGTGMRWSEATALRVGEVDLDGLGTVKIVRATKWVPGSGHDDDGVPKSKKSRRTIIAAWQVQDVLRPLLEGKKSSDLVFTSVTGKPVRHATFHRLVWKPTIAKADLGHVRIHDLRHTHASWLLEFGMSLEQVQDQLGHESIITTRNTYGHLQPAMREALQTAAEKALSVGRSQQRAIEG